MYVCAGGDLSGGGDDVAHRSGMLPAHGGAMPSVATGLAGGAGDADVTNNNTAGDFGIKRFGFKSKAVRVTSCNGPQRVGPGPAPGLEPQVQQRAEERERGSNRPAALPVGAGGLEQVQEQEQEREDSLLDEATWAEGEDLPTRKRRAGAQAQQSPPNRTAVLVDGTKRRVSPEGVERRAAVPLPPLPPPALLPRSGLSSSDLQAAVLARPEAPALPACIAGWSAAVEARVASCDQHKDGAGAPAVESGEQHSVPGGHTWDACAPGGSLGTSLPLQEQGMQRMLHPLPTKVGIAMPVPTQLPAASSQQPPQPLAVAQQQPSAPSPPLAPAVAQPRLPPTDENAAPAPPAKLLGSSPMGPPAKLQALALPASSVDPAAASVNDGQPQHPRPVPPPPMFDGTPSIRHAENREPLR